MNPTYQLIDLEKDGEVAFARLRINRLDENGVHLLGDELTRLIEAEGFRKIILSMGGETLHCLYSVFLSKLVMIQRHLNENEGRMVLCDVPPEVHAIFGACKLADYFTFAPDRAAARAALGEPSA